MRAEGRAQGYRYRLTHADRGQRHARLRSAAARPAAVRGHTRLSAHERTGEEARLAGSDLGELVLPRRANSRRIPAPRFGDPRVIALLAAPVQLCYRAAGFRHAHLRHSVAALLGCVPQHSHWTTFDAALGALSTEARIAA